MKLFKLFLFALALSFVAPQAIDAKPRKKARTHKKARRRGGHKHHYVQDGGWFTCTICGRNIERLNGKKAKYVDDHIYY